MSDMLDVFSGSLRFLLTETAQLWSDWCLPVSEVFTKCPSDVSSFGRYCYVVLEGDGDGEYQDFMCLIYRGHTAWLESAAELEWLGDLLAAYSIDCIHLGTPHN